MTTFGWVCLASVAGGVLSLALAGLVAFSARPAWIPALVSFAIGTLLGAVFLEILPHAFQGAKSIHTVAATILGGILAFFVLEKLVLWRHFHLEDFEAGAAPPGQGRGHGHGHDHGRSGLMITIGDSFHNFVDGILIAAAFVESTQLGFVVAAAVIAHEIPQEIGDFIILLHSGYSTGLAVMLNVLASLAMLAGALLGYFALQALSQWTGVVLALAAASMIYVAVADLIPGLHKRTELKATVQQVVLIGLGVFSIWLVGELTH